MKIAHQMDQYVLLFFVIAIFLFGTGVASGGLIEPTRSLDGAEKQVGQISVFSEPPEMQVAIDGEKVGVTPLINFKIENGLHNIMIDKDKTEIYVTSEKPIRLAYFKGKFIEISERPSATTPPPKFETETKRPRSQDHRQSSDMPPSPFYWPIRPSGPIY